MLEDVEASPADPSDPGARLVLGDRYRLDGILGRGGMATVHRAHDLLLGRDVAVKVFPAVHADADDLLRNRAEIRVLATLSHPGLVTLHDAGTVHGADDTQQVFLVMELVEGPTLAERLRQGALGIEQTAVLGRDVAEALAVVHEREIIHRDIKPANILLTSAHGLDAGGRGAGPAAKLADFGIARLAGATRLTMTGMTLGTMSYLSPEQATGGAIGPPSDVYGLGLVLLECATGRPAFVGTPAEIVSARLVASPEIPAELGPRLGDLLSRMTRLAPDERPGAADVARDLAEILGAPSGETLAMPTPVAVPAGDETLAMPAPVAVSASDGTLAMPVAVAVSASDGTLAMPVAVAGPAGDGTLAMPVAVAGPAGDETLAMPAPVADPPGDETPAMPAPVAVAASRERDSGPWARLRSARVALIGGAAALLVLGTVLVGQMASGGDTPADPPSYPAVEGTVGESLTRLQESVAP